ncbi:hypothetical protein MWU63_13730 [Pseudohalocynthiibacter sp. F2068]|nr:hypothetical protein [Pseudohalocynthiibacter sp. F2068]
MANTIVTLKNIPGCSRLTLASPGHVMHNRPVTPVEDFTNPFLVSLFVFLFSALIAIWAAYGMIPALTLSAFLNIGINLGS